LSGKNDTNDSAAICAAVRQPQLRFVAVKSAEQQARLVVHRLRQGWQEERTANLNRLRGLLAEFGRVYPNSAAAAVAGARTALADDTLPRALRRGVARLLDHLRELDQRIDECDREIAQDAAADPRARRAARLSGVGVLTASAVAATVADPQQFRCGRQFAAWIGLTPRQYSTGGKPRLGRITRRGDTYLRGLLVQGARSALQAALRAPPTRRTRLAAWIVTTYERIGYHKTLVAIANKHARLLWVLLTRDEPLRAHAAMN
jgi:transposase